MSCKVHCFNMIWEISRMHVADNNMSHSLTNWRWHLNVANILQNYSNNILFSIFESWKESKLFHATDSNLIARHWSNPTPPLYTWIQNKICKWQQIEKKNLTYEKKKIDHDLNMTPFSIWDVTESLIVNM